MQRKTVDWNNIIAQIKSYESVYCIMEEPVDAEVQKAFVQLKERLSANKSYFKKLCRSAQETPEIISDVALPFNILKRTLVALSSVDYIPNFREIEKFVKSSTGIRQKWGIVALQQSRMLIETSLYGGTHPGIFISSGLGAVGKCLRYFCIFVFNKEKETEEFQEELLYKESLYTVRKAGGSVEKFSLSAKFATLTLLLPIECNLVETIGSIIKECNKYGNFINKKVIVTNIKEFSKKEIMEHIVNKR